MEYELVLLSTFVLLIKANNHEVVYYLVSTTGKLIVWGYDQSIQIPT